MKTFEHTQNLRIGFAIFTAIFAFTFYIAACYFNGNFRFARNHDEKRNRRKFKHHRKIVHRDVLVNACENHKRNVDKIEAVARRKYDKSLVIGICCFFVCLFSSSSKSATENGYRFLSLKHIANFNWQLVCKSPSVSISSYDLSQILRIVQPVDLRLLQSRLQTPAR